MVALSGVALLVGGTSLSIGIRLPRTYAASVTIDVDEGDSSPVSLLPNIAQTVLGGGSDLETMQTIIHRVSSRTVLDQARRDYDDVEPLGSRLLPPTAHLTKQISAGVQQGSRLIGVTVEMREDQGGSRNAVGFANQLVETFRRRLADEELTDKAEDTRRQLAQIETLQAELQTKLNGMREGLIDFARDEGNPTLWSAELTQLFTRQTTLMAERRQASFKLGGATASEARAQQELAIAPEFALTGRSSGANPFRTAIYSELLKLDAEAARKKGEGYAEKAPEREGIVEARAFVEERLQNTPDHAITETFSIDPTRNALETRRLNSAFLAAEAGKEIAELDTLLASVSAEIEAKTTAIPDRQVRLQILEREAESVANVYEELLLRQSQMRLALGETQAREEQSGRRIGGVAVTDLARPQLRPIKPRTTLLAAIAVALGVLCGVGAGLLMEWQRMVAMPEGEPSVTVEEEGAFIRRKQKENT